MIELLAKWHWLFTTNRDHPGFRRALAELGRECGLSASEWRELNQRRLRQLLVFARDRVPYYGRLFAEHGFSPEKADLPNALQQIPVLTKEIIRAKRELLVAEGVRQSDTFENSTGGSTGTPLTFRQDKHYAATATALDVYARGWWGIAPFARTASIWGADREFHELSLRERFYDWRHRQRSINAFRMTESELSEFCRMLRRWKPPYLIGYASALDALAQFAEANGFGDLRFKAIRSAAEMLWPEHRQRIEGVFQSPVHNFYGSREVNNLAAECPECRRLHLIATWRYVEIVNERGQSVTAGKVGYVCSNRSEQSRDALHPVLQRRYGRLVAKSVCLRKAVAGDRATWLAAAATSFGPPTGT